MSFLSFFVLFIMSVLLQICAGVNENFLNYTDKSGNLGKYLYEKSRYNTDYNNGYKLRFDPTYLKQNTRPTDINFPAGLPTVPTLNNAGVTTAFPLPAIPNPIGPNLIPIPNPMVPNIIPVPNPAGPPTLPVGNPIAPPINPMVINILPVPNPAGLPTLPVGNPIVPPINRPGLLPNQFPIINQLRPGIIRPNLIPGSFTNNIYPNQTTPYMVRPQNSQSQSLSNMVALMANRLGNIIFGKGPTFVKRPETGKGFLNLFDVIKFENGPCSATLNRIRWLNGTCYHQSECETRGGFSVGKCAEGYGVCCIFKFGCGESTQQEVSYFESPKYPSASVDPLSCTLSVNLNHNVRQIRLDLLFFELKQPLNGNCVEDQLVISGQNPNLPVPVLCGINSGQHMYIDVERSPERKIFISVFGRSYGARAFSIRITQIYLHHLMAPRNCLQYFTEPVGYIKSFNYDNVANIVEIRTPSYLNNLNYAICIERAPNKCAITYTNQVAEGELQFQLRNLNNQLISLVPPNQAGAEIFNCPDDFIAINSLRLCGDKLNDASNLQDLRVNAPITDFGLGPIVLPFRTNEAVVGRGFKLVYYQESCD